MSKLIAGVIIGAAVSEIGGYVAIKAVIDLLNQIIIYFRI